MPWQPVSVSELLRIEKGVLSCPQCPVLTWSPGAVTCWVTVGQCQPREQQQLCSHHISTLQGLCYHLRVMQGSEGDTGMKGDTVQELHLGNEQPGGEEGTGSMWSGQLSHPSSGSVALCPGSTPRVDTHGQSRRVHGKGSLDGFIPHPLLLITRAIVEDVIQSR